MSNEFDRVTSRNHLACFRLKGKQKGASWTDERDQDGNQERKVKMLKKFMASAALAASVVGVAAAGAPQALAIGDDSGTTSASGNGASQSFGNSATFGDMSPQLSLVQGSLNKPCVALPSKLNTQTLAAPVTGDVIGLQDVGILSSPQTQTCTENSTQAKGDEPLSHVLDDIAALSGNGVGNG
jgi:hypothetical protein